MPFSVFSSLAEQLGIPYAEHVSLRTCCSMRVGGQARYMAYPTDAPSLTRLILALRERACPYAVIGAMTNTLPPDGELMYPLICTRRMTDTERIGDTVRAACGASLSGLAIRYMREGRDACAALATVPGTVGGAVRGNAGAYGRQTSEYVISCEVLDVRRGAVVTYPASQMAFSYRHSRLKGTEDVLLSVLLRAPRRAADVMLEEHRQLRERRLREQPREPSLGSVFLRLPDGRSVGEVLDRLGCKGVSFGDAVVSHRHAGFIINRRAATASDVRSLIYYLQQRVKAAEGLVPVTEISVLPRRGSYVVFDGTEA